MASTAMSQALSSAQVTGDGAATNNHSPKTFLDLPKEIRLEIYDWIFYSTTLEADRGTGIPLAVASPRSERKAQPILDQGDAEDGRGDEDDEDGEDGEDGEDEPSGSSRADTMFLTPIMSPQLNLVCKLMNSDIAQSWHGKVTYWFPCTVAFIDVLSQWSGSKLRSVRHVHIVGYPLPLYPVDRDSCFITHLVYDALPIFPGLRLDVLTVENIWLDPDGEGISPWCLDAAYWELVSLLASSGWKEFKYLSGTLCFLSRQMRGLDLEVTKMKQKRGEESYSNRVSAPRPRSCRMVHPDDRGHHTPSDAEDQAEVEGWESQHPDFVGPTEKEIQVWARRGTDQYTQSGEERAECIKGLLERFTWLELRESTNKLVGDGTDDPAAHL